MNRITFITDIDMSTWIYIGIAITTLFLKLSGVINNLEFFLLTIGIAAVYSITIIILFKLEKISKNKQVSKFGFVIINKQDGNKNA